MKVIKLFMIILILSFSLPVNAYTDSSSENTRVVHAPNDIFIYANIFPLKTSEFISSYSRTETEFHCCNVGTEYNGGATIDTTLHYVPGGTTTWYLDMDKVWGNNFGSIGNAYIHYEDGTELANTSIIIPTQNSLTRIQFNATFSGTSLTKKIQYMEIRQNTNQYTYIFHYFNNETNLPNITSWSNTKTNNQTHNISINPLESVTFNVTVNQSIDTWNWTINGDEQYNNESTLNAIFAEGLFNVTLNATNLVGKTNTMYWNVNSSNNNIPGENYNIEGYIHYQDVNNSVYRLNNAYVSVSSAQYDYSDINGYYIIINVSGTKTLSVNKTLGFNNPSISISNGDSNPNNFTLLYSKPSISSPYVDGNMISGNYSHNFKSMNLWENPYFVWGKYNFDDNLSLQRVCVNSGTKFSCDLIPNKNYTFNFYYSDIYNYNLNTYHPSLTGNRTFNSTQISIQNGIIKTIQSSYKSVSLLPQKDREKSLKNDFFDYLFIMVFIIVICLIGSFTHKR